MLRFTPAIRDKAFSTFLLHVMFSEITNVDKITTEFTIILVNVVIVCYIYVVSSVTVSREVFQSTYLLATRARQTIVGRDESQIIHNFYHLRGAKAKSIIRPVST